MFNVTFYIYAYWTPECQSKIRFTPTPHCQTTAFSSCRWLNNSWWSLRTPSIVTWSKIISCTIEIASDILKYSFVKLLYMRQPVFVWFTGDTIAIICTDTASEQPTGQRHSAVLRLHVVRPSVCPSVHLSMTLVDQDHIGWQSWKLPAREISPTPSLFVVQRSSTYSQGNMGKFGGD